MEDVDDAEETEEEEEQSDFHGDGISVGGNVDEENDNLSIYKNLH